VTTHERPPTTTDAGIPVASDEHSLSVGPDGPLLLQDHYLIEQMATFNRERIPERQPHAKGGGASWSPSGRELAIGGGDDKTLRVLRPF
jgi:catalase